ncbi:hypothetical protein GQR58_002247 [Nymphon striatum]|nr:hypothetical protein GQR58_002247 [Nymphon striatum]
MTLAASCGSLQRNSVGLELASGVFSSVLGSPDSAEGENVALTRELIEAQETDLLRVSIISRDATSFLVTGGTNGTKVTWLSPDGLSLTFDRGVLVASRGFGDDLMGADVSDALASMESGGNHLRTLDFLTSLDQIERRDFQCETVVSRSEELTIVERTYQTKVIEESCTDGDFSFQNTYWRDVNGVIWQSRQWISPQTGYLGYQRLFAMKITTLIAAAALATASTAATAQNVTTDAGEVVMIEKNGGLFALTGLGGAAAIGFAFAAIVTVAKTNEGT